MKVFRQEKEFDHFCRGALYIAIAMYVAFVTIDIFYIDKTVFQYKDDSEIAYYYFTRMVQINEPFFHPHPGTIIVYLFYFYVRVSSLFTDDISTIFNVWYVILLGLTVTSIWFSYIIFPYRFRKFIGWSLMLFMSFPSNIYYLTYFSTDSLYLLSTLPCISFLMRIFLEERKLKYNEVLIIGASLGFLMACKFSQTPLFLISCSMLFMHLLQYETCSRAWIKVFITVTSSILVFFLTLVPVFDQVPMLLIYIISYGSSSSLEKLNWDGFFAYPSLVVVISLSVFLMIKLLFSFIRFKCNKLEVIMYTYGVLVFMGFLYLVCKGLSGSEVSNISDLRNASPYLVALLPLAILATNNYGDQLKKYEMVISVSLLCIVCQSLYSVWLLNFRVVVDGKMRDKDVSQFIVDRLGMDKRVAIWDGENSGVGKSKFHLWGNYRYARGYFEDEMVTQYPNYAIFDYRQLPNMNNENSIASIKSEQFSPFKVSLMPLTLGLWHRFWPLKREVFNLDQRDLCSGLNEKSIYGILIFIDQEDVLNNYNRDKLVKIISDEKKLGKVSAVEDVRIGNRPCLWIKLEHDFG